MVWVPYVCIPAILVINVIAYACNPHSWPRRRLARGRPGGRDPALLAITNRAAGVSRQQAAASFWAWELLEPSHCVTSPLLPPWALLVLRLAGLAYFVSYFFVKAFVDFDLKPNWLLFFTNWSFCVFALSMLLGACHSAWDMRRRRQAGRLPLAASLAHHGEATDGQELLQDAAAADTGHAFSEVELSAAAHFGSGNGAVVGNGGAMCKPSLLIAPAGAAATWPLLAKVHLLSTEVACASELFLTAFYWALLHSGSEDDLATNLMVHGINNVFMLADVALSHLPFVSYHFQAVLLYGTAYLTFMWIRFGVSGEWTYSTLDWSKSASLAFYLLLPCLLALAFFLYWGLAWGRERLWGQRRKQPGTSGDRKSVV